MVALDLIPLLGAFLAFAVCYALLVAYRSTIGALLATLAQASYGISILGYHPFHWLGDGITALNSTVNNALAATVQGTEYAWAKVLHANAVLWHDATAALADLAEATESRLSHLPAAITQTIVPAWVWPLRATVHVLQRLEARTETDVAKLAHAAAHAVAPPVTREIHDATKVTNVTIKAAIAAIPSAIGIPLPRVGVLERDVTGLEKWVRAHRDAVTAGALTGALALSLARLGLSSSRCSRVQKYNKAVCGMDDGLLDALLADALIIGSTISIVALAKDCQGFLSDVEAPLRLFVRELHGITPTPGPDAADQLAAFAAGRY